MSVSTIAKRAGVSIATVSRVLNNSRPVNPELAERVRRAVAELKISPRTTRRRTRTDGDVRHRTIAIVSVGQSYRTWFDVPVIANIVAELTRAAQARHMSILMTEMIDPNELGPTLRRPNVDGAIVFVNSAVRTEQLHRLTSHLPVVRVMGGQIAPAQFDIVGPDNTCVGYMAARYLTEKGLNNLAFLTTAPSWDICRFRAQGFMIGAMDAGLMPRIYVAGAGAQLGVAGVGAVVEPTLDRLVARLREHHTGPLGLFVTRDEETVNVYRHLAENGLSPGQDVVVVSCDNEAVRLSTLHPRPASIDLNAPEIADRAIRRLESRIAHAEDPPVRVLVNPKLIEPETD